MKINIYLSVEMTDEQLNKFRQSVYGKKGRATREEVRVFMSQIIKDNFDKEFGNHDVEFTVEGLSDQAEIDKVAAHSKAEAEPTPATETSSTTAAAEPAAPATDVSDDEAEEEPVEAAATDA